MENIFIQKFKKWVIQKFKKWVKKWATVRGVVITVFILAQRKIIDFQKSFATGELIHNGNFLKFIWQIFFWRFCGSDPNCQTVSYSRSDWWIILHQDWWWFQIWRNNFTVSMLNISILIFRSPSDKNSDFEHEIFVSKTKMIFCDQILNILCW